LFQEPLMLLCKPKLFFVGEPQEMAASEVVQAVLCFSRECSRWYLQRSWHEKELNLVISLPGAKIKVMIW